MNNSLLEPKLEMKIYKVALEKNITFDEAIIFLLEKMLSPSYMIKV